MGGGRLDSYIEGREVRQLYRGERVTNYIHWEYLGYRGFISFKHKILFFDIKIYKGVLYTEITSLKPVHNIQV